MEKILDDDMVQEIMNEIIKSPVFCSEADFKYRFARAAEEKYGYGRCSGFKVYLEYRMYSFIKPDAVLPDQIINKTGDHLDLVICINEKMIPVEFKYKVAIKGRNIGPRKNDEFYRYSDGYVDDTKFGGFDVRDPLAYDDCRYAFLKDICRVEKALKYTRYDSADVGYVIFMTNYKGFWTVHEDKNGNTMDLQSVGTVKDIGRKYDGKDRYPNLPFESPTPYKVDWDDAGPVSVGEWELPQFKYTTVKVEKLKSKLCVRV